MRDKIILLIGGSIIILINLIGIFSFYTASNNILEEHVIAHLETAVESRASHIETFLDEQKEKVLLIADTDLYEDFLFSETDNEEEIEEINEELKEILESNFDFSGIFLLNKKGIIVASANRRSLGNFHEGRVVEEESGAEISKIYYSDLLKENVLDVSAPVVKDDVDLVGTAVLEVGLKELVEITTQRTGLGETGEIIIINKEGLLLTPSRFLGGNEGVLVQEVKTENAEECIEDLREFEEIESEFEEIDDFRFSDSYTGEKTIGVDYPLFEVEWCVLAEIQESEVLGKPKIFLAIISLIIVLTTAILIILFVLLGQKFKGWKK